MTHQTELKRQCAYKLDFLVEPAQSEQLSKRPKVAKIDERNDPIIEKDSILNKKAINIHGARLSKTRYVQAANTTRRDEPNGERNEERNATYR